MAEAMEVRMPWHMSAEAISIMALVSGGRAGAPAGTCLTRAAPGRGSCRCPAVHTQANWGARLVNQGDHLAHDEVWHLACVDGEKEGGRLILLVPFRKRILVESKMYPRFAPSYNVS